MHGRLLVFGPLMSDLATGIAAGNDAFGPWEIVHRDLGDREHLDLADTDAVLAYIAGMRHRDYLARFDGPMLNFSGAIPSSEQLPRITWDNEAAGRMAAEHFLERGYEHGAFMGYDDAAFSDERRQGFCSRMASEAATVHELPAWTFFDPTTLPSTANLAASLVGLPRPLAVFAVNDQTARRIAEAASLAGLAVPEDLAILGCDDSPDALLAPVAISSIVPPLEEIGYHAVRLLTAACHGEPLPPDTRILPPCIRTRLSTIEHAIPDKRVAAAIAWIRQHLSECIFVADVAAATAISRRSLESAFEASHVRSPKGEIEYQRTRLAKRLLYASDLGLADVARRCGYRDRQRFSVAFKREAGATPGAWREQHRANGSG